jgi:xanthine dehydrogenase YagT iron-sulfur-binding subunit
VDNELTRRTFLGTAALVPGVVLAEPAADVQTEPCSLTINNVRHDLNIEPRVTLLDLLREHLHMPGTKKGCDHGQCGACTVIINGERVISCLTLAISRDGDSITTIEGLATGDQLHPMQAAFLEHDGFQCGFCSGQICSAVAMLDEAHKGMPTR